MEHRGHVLVFNDRIAGRFLTRKAAWAEQGRLSALAFKRGESCTSRIRWEPPMPQTEQEANEAALDATLY
jgi:hypothetical protein